MRLTTILALATSVTLLTACGDDSTTEPGPFASVAGDFESTRFEFTSSADPNVRQNLVLPGSNPFVLRLTPTGQFSSNFTTASGATVARSGTFTTTGTQIRFSDDPFTDDDAVAERSFGFSRTSTRLTIDDPATEFDFGTGTLEPASLNAEFDQVAQ